LALAPAVQNVVNGPASQIQMVEKKITIAILGLNKQGLELLETASRCGNFDIKAVADPDTKLQQQVSEKYNCHGYDDYRQLIVQNQPDFLFVAAPTHTCSEHIAAAIKKNFNILKLTPPARNFDEAVKFVHAAKEHNVTFAVANLHRFSPIYRRLREALQQIPPESIYLISLICCDNNPPDHDWHNDPRLAGGGVLLQNCYGLLDQIILNFSMPQKVYALNLNQAPDKKQRQYMTEDTAIVNMRFSDRLVANIVASNTFGPTQKVLKIYAQDKILTLTNESLTFCDKFGKPLDEFKASTQADTPASALLASIANHLKNPQQNPLANTAHDNLPNMAVLEAAYLSDRTAMPEEPARILQRAQKHTANF